MGVFYLQKLNSKKEGFMNNKLLSKIMAITFIIFALMLMTTGYAISGIWTPMASGTTYQLNGIWGSSSTDVFAVGEDGIIMHYNGSTWSSMSSGTTGWFTGVGAVPAVMCSLWTMVAPSSTIMVAHGLR
jgi:hypothetical protein